MSETVTLPIAELEALRGRVSALARDNAHLKLINGMLIRLSSANGLDDVIEHILNILMETIGGSNIVVYYALEGYWYSRDIFGEVRDMDAPDAPLVLLCMRERVFLRIESPDVTQFFGDFSSETWAFPLLVQQRLVGVVVMEGMQIAKASIHRELQPFFVYAALMLGNEISNYSVLEMAHKELLATHRALEQEAVARREAENLYQLLFEQSPDGILLIDPETFRPLQFNSAAHQQLGYTRDEFAAITIPEFEAQEDCEAVGRHARLVLEQGCDTFETRQRTKVGELRDVHVTLKRMTVGGRMLLHAMYHDITTIKKMEQELFKTRKLESVGVLAGGIAHDFNNLLAAIIGNISLAGMFIQPDSRAAGLLAESEKACLRARDLTKQLLTFSKGGAPIRKAASIADLVRESASFAVRGTAAGCDFRIADDLWSAEIDQGQISQVIHNLALNAEQAMPSGGVITISCENIPGAPGADSLGNCVRISIADQGEGIPCEILPRIFDPYFTTKTQGSGLGLASSYSIINKHGGRIEVDSIPGQGTTFHLYLPAFAGAAIQDRVEAAGPQARSCKILVMDDEDMLLAVASGMLGLLGHRAETARDGREALELYQRARNTEEPFSGVILDLTIPGGMGGRETLSRLLELDPGVKAIVSSGYASGTVMSDYRSCGFSGVLSKPYSLKDLIRVLGEVFPKDGGDH